MQQEARNTEGRGIWRTGVSLRHRTVQFVCAQDSRLDQEIEPPSPNVTEDICTEKAAKEKPCHPTDISLPGYQGEFNDLVAKAARVVNPDSVTSSLQTSTDSSEDEIVFRGRRKDQDWKLLSTSSRVQQSIIGNNSTPFGGIQRGDLQSPPAKPGNEFFSISDDAFDPTPDREDVTYFPLNLKKQKKEGRRTMDENDALADYIANIDEEYLMPNSHSHSVETLGHDIQASDPAMPIASLNSMSSASMKLLISHDDQSPPQRNDRSTIQEGHGNRNVGVSGCK
ncbi:hypothetical protein BO70DRAFT_188886 [Aspergillus heteromorphus CBS 117.55]|uniref:Uncharacterized protein n=1 Tax=Aspergillus heteromorphus CBS 117.55 TaxID=1448321 RepID=A0A317UUG7_9EURO|nr:uncharacterized protein BO70DRAFT_188886 [Aspergillus heteromorphus CBS 117.55]PWY65026.1 hypothetical protein BO70DRAFT_188886 [Aspergillus heteromorphus CBS 117.55]